MAVRKKLERLSWACGCAHEERLQKYLRAGGDIAEQNAVLTLLCPLAVREGYPNCAHVESQGRDPDPYGKEIRILCEQGVLDPQYWLRWLQEMRFRILAVDVTIAKADPTMHSREELQTENIAELRRVGEELVKILTAAQDRIPVK